jgi:hypothetical protein
LGSLEGVKGSNVTIEALGCAVFGARLSDSSLFPGDGGSSDSFVEGKVSQGPIESSSVGISVLDESSEGDLSCSCWGSLEVDDRVVWLELSRVMHHSVFAGVSREVLPWLIEPSRVFHGEIPASNLLFSGVNCVEQKSSVQHSIAVNVHINFGVSVWNILDSRRS